MNNKQYLLTVLENLRDDWEMAESLLTVIQTVDVNTSTIDAISKIIKNAIASIDSQESTEKMTEGLKVIEKIKSMESKSKEDEKEELSQLEKMLSEM